MAVVTRSIVRQLVIPRLRIEVDNVDVIAERLPSPVLTGSGSRVCGLSALSAPDGAPLSYVVHPTPTGPRHETCVDGRDDDHSSKTQVSWRPRRHTVLTSGTPGR